LAAACSAAGYHRRWLPQTNSAAFLAEALPHGLDEEHPGHPMGCPPIWDSALLAHSLLTPQQIASLRQFRDSTQQEWGRSNPPSTQFVKTHTTKNHQSEKAPQISLTKEGKREGEVSKGAGTRGVTVIMWQVSPGKASGGAGRGGC